MAKKLIAELPDLISKVGVARFFYSSAMSGAFWLLLAQVGQVAQAAEAVCQTKLGQQIQTVIQRPEFRQARWGILIQTVSDNPQTLYAQDAEKLFIPASNAKLLTTAAALTQLGPNFRIRTSVYLLRSSSNQVILRLVGRGDPSLTQAQLQNLAQQLQNRGIAEIDQLVADDQYFQGDLVNPTWEWEDVQAGYGAPVSSLILNQNAINLTLLPQALGQPLGITWDDPTDAKDWQVVNRSRTVAADAEEFVQVGRDLSRPLLYVQGQLRAGSASEPVAVSIPQPTQYFLAQFQQVLAAAKIPVARTAIATDSRSVPSVQEVAAVESPRLAELIVETNQQSNNLYAESLLRQLGVGLSGDASSLEKGIEALEATLTKLGVDPQHYTLVDGSGLSRRNLISPVALVQTLQGMARSPDAASYRASLSTAGTNGTLQGRFRGIPVEGKFYGKTGVLSGAVALSGYVELIDSTQLAISILVNQTELPLSEIQAAMDAVVQLVIQADSSEPTNQLPNQTEHC